MKSPLAAFRPSDSSIRCKDVERTVKGTALERFLSAAVLGKSIVCCTAEYASFQPSVKKVNFAHISITVEVIITSAFLYIL